MNCCINVRGGNKNLNFQHKCQANKGNSAQKECNFIAASSTQSRNCDFGTSFYCLTIEQFLLQVWNKVYVLTGCIKGCSKVKLYNKVFLIANVCKKVAQFRVLCVLSK